MTLAVGVVFSPGGKVYSFDANGLDLHWNEYVICQTSRGLEHGRVVQARREHDETAGPPLRKIVRRATPRDAETVKKNQTAAREVMRAFKAALRGNGDVGVRAVAAEIVFDGSRVVLSFRAEERIELKHLAGSLQREIGRRVELRQVNPREAARVCGSGGLCGERKCCNRFPSHQQPITLPVAEDQD